MNNELTKKNIIKFCSKDLAELTGFEIIMLIIN